MPAESNLHVLFEHAAGFAAFKVREFEEESMFLAEVICFFFLFLAVRQGSGVCSNTTMYEFYFLLSLK